MPGAWDIAYVTAHTSSAGGCWGLWLLQEPGARRHGWTPFISFRQKLSPTGSLEFYRPLAQLGPGYLHSLLPHISIIGLTWPPSSWVLHLAQLAKPSHWDLDESAVCFDIEHPKIICERLSSAWVMDLELVSSVIANYPVRICPCSSGIVILSVSMTLDYETSWKYVWLCT